MPVETAPDWFQPLLLCCLDSGTFRSLGEEKAHGSKWSCLLNKGAPWNPCYFKRLYRGGWRWTGAKGSLLVVSGFLPLPAISLLGS